MRLARTAPLLAALALGASACVPAARFEPARSESLLSRLPPPVGRECRVASAPEALPRVDQLVDREALSEALVELWASAGVDTGYAIFSLEIDENGWNARREVIEHDVAPAVADSMQALVFTHRRALEPGEPFGVRLRVDASAAPAFEVGRREHCAPKLVDAGELDASDPWSVRNTLAPSLAMNTVWVRVLVDERGGVADARVERSPVTIRWEGALMNVLHSLSFEPALVDGIPVRSWVRVPIPARRL